MGGIIVKSLYADRRDMHKTKTLRGHSPSDSIAIDSLFVVNRFQESSFNLHGTSQILFFSDSFQRYFHNANINFTPYED